MHDAGAYPHACREIDVIETHISYVMLTGEIAYKIKKPVSFPFVDFSTLEMRRQSCHDELRLNRRLAQQLYLEVVPIGGTPQRPRVGATPAIEYAVAMVQFDPEQTLDKLLRRVAIDPVAIQELAAQIASFHAELDPVDGHAPGETALSNLAALREEIDGSADRRLAAIGDWLTERAAALAADFRQRASEGFIRECHGDLHLGNLVQIGDRIQAFDCIEFNKALRSIDTLDEVAFLFMDFLAHERAHLGFEFLNRYLERTGDYAGMRVFRFYVVHRALVRAYVRALAVSLRDRNGAQPYLDLAAELVEPNTPLLVITTGLSGSGKTTVTDALIGRL
ncbi:MAG TPA: phosphotransferase, partial [Gammaproteobacteria bacterium]|nr:phosphotransferase [Gammaproteobacteria bacterium]